MGRGCLGRTKNLGSGCLVVVTPTCVGMLRRTCVSLRGLLFSSYSVEASCIQVVCRYGQQVNEFARTPSGNSKEMVVVCGREGMDIRGDQRPFNGPLRVVSIMVFSRVPVGSIAYAMTTTPIHTARGTSVVSGHAPGVNIQMTAIASHIVIQPFTSLDPRRQRQTRRKVQADYAPPSLPQHEREQGELEDESAGE
jgi:hypothetical protein